MVESKRRRQDTESLTDLKAMTVLHGEKKDWRSELNKFLLAYRFTAHTTAGKSPAELLHGRQICTKLLEVAGFDEYEETVNQATRDYGAERKQAGADYAD